MSSISPSIDELQQAIEALGKVIQDIESARNQIPNDFPNTRRLLADFRLTLMQTRIALVHKAGSLQRKALTRAHEREPIDLRISPGRFKKGEWVYTCRCGREGEREWMVQHVREAHGVREARVVDVWIRYMPKRREYVNIRGV